MSLCMKQQLYLVVVWDLDTNYDINRYNLVCTWLTYAQNCWIFPTNWIIYYRGKLCLGFWKLLRLKTINTTIFVCFIPTVICEGSRHAEALSVVSSAMSRLSAQLLVGRHTVNISSQSDTNTSAHNSFVPLLWSVNSVLRVPVPSANNERN